MIEREVMRLKGDEVMRDCRPGMLLKIAAFLLFLVFFLPMTGLCLYLAFAPSLPREDRLLFAAGVLMSAGWWCMPPTVRSIRELAGWSTTRRR